MIIFAVELRAIQSKNVIVFYVCFTVDNFEKISTPHNELIFK